jgi:ribosomal protein S18 acetylase RimI-like enzyme
MTVNTRTLTILPATPEHAWAVQRLFKGLHDFNARLDPRFELADEWERYLDEHLRREWNGAQSLTLVAWDADRPIALLMLAGYCDSPLFKYRQWAEILALYIDPDVRGGMLALRLIRMARKWATENGYDRIQLYVTASNERAKKFYDKTGFKPVQEVWRLELGSRSADGPGSGHAETCEIEPDPLTPRPHDLHGDD